MIRKTLLLLALTIVAIKVAGYVPDKEDFSFLNQLPSVTVRLDFSNADVEDFTAGEFEKYVESRTDTVMKVFLRELNKITLKKNVRFREEKSYTYLFLVQVLSIEEDGAVKAMVTVIDINTVSQIGNFKLKAHGGVFGGFEQLFIEGMGRLGENLGDYIIENMK